MSQLAEKIDPSWKAFLHLSLQQHLGKTCLVPQKRFGPLTVQRPFYPEQATCHVYLLHPPGGIVGGDELTLKIDCDTHTHSLITTPGATKFYRSAGKTALFQQSFKVAEEAILEFLPLENIYFPGAKVDAQTDIYLSKGSQCIFWESHCFGRPANHEAFDTGELRLKLNIYDEQVLLLTDRQVINKTELQRHCGARGFSVLTTMVIVSDHLSDHLLTALRAVSLTSGYAGISQLNERLLTVRVMSDSTLINADYLKTLWTLARPEVLQKAACPPRIWQT